MRLGEFISLVLMLTLLLVPLVGFGFYLGQVGESLYRKWTELTMLTSPMFELPYDVVW